MELRTSYGKRRDGVFPDRLFPSGVDGTKAGASASQNKVMRIIMTMLQHELTDFTVNAFQNDDFHEVSKKDVLGHWSVFDDVPLVGV